MDTQTSLDVLLSTIFWQNGFLSIALCPLVSIRNNSFLCEPLETHFPNVSVGRATQCNNISVYFKCEHSIRYNNSKLDGKIMYAQSKFVVFFCIFAQNKEKMQKSLIQFYLVILASCYMHNTKKNWWLSSQYSVFYDNHWKFIALKCTNGWKFVYLCVMVQANTHHQQVF